MKSIITVFGLGFVGLTTALAFAEKGNKVYGYDTDNIRAETIKNGVLPFVEPGLDNALAKHINNGFTIVNDPKSAVSESDFIFLCVGTPCGEKGEADLKYIYSVIDNIYLQLNDDKYRVVVIKSTVPPSTTSERVIPYLKNKGLEVGEKFTVANNPEFLREGHCWDDMINADRIVCGVSDKKGEDMLLSLYENFNIPFYAVSLNTGEFIKYLSNTLLATMISYSNEMSKVAYTIGDIQIKEAFKILHMDKRWKTGNMSSYVYPGCGYGGYCLPKDTQAMYEKSTSKGYEPMILKNVIKVNNSMPDFMTDKIIRDINEEDKVGILGLSFKPGSDDVRDSSSAKIIKILIDKGYKNILVYDPIANKVFKEKYKFKEIDYYNDIDSLCNNSDILVLATAWNEFIDIKEKYPNKKIVDCRYLL
ncbi:UDP-glucose 6-dehydrogenase [Clostridium botulinum]|uniref:UDP-glucose 6-dehydrogenase n=1 Tax=Clostridium botulinum TaxID=1491 RepID=A0AAU8YUX0_CLOBO|nr:nucleotide sugar dehydrogenase [Clostridium sporogenes]AVP64061.1 UDP-glucose 6-dehydrogenase [Clostridium botulinum]MBW5456413.1 nucleotide sugar dehydrogenase [Clostridium sporogenes]MCF4016643.1 nucleotide sugar dehydrogenase [Clostridium sporogenes]MDS1006796.1 nucleotide sugar dehydrogenase [Clostridium sporogenes]NFG03768.1 UDP-glucose/GDP-mannose dehydrogenase family protein [Clostridium sporogenes]